MLVSSYLKQEPYIIVTFDVSHKIEHTMKRISIALFLFGLVSLSNAQYDNSEKMSVLAGFVSTGSEFVFWSDNVYGGSLQLNYDVKKIEEGAIALKASTALSGGYQGYYGGANFRVGSRFFGDMDALFGYSSITDSKLLDNYGVGVAEYKGTAFVCNIGIGYRFADNPLFIRFAYGGHFPINQTGLNTDFSLQLGFRIK